MTRRLAIADSPALSLPLDAVTQKLAFLGRTGSGKTYGATKLAECMLDAGAQIVVLDVVGAWWGLRLAENGKAAGIAIPVFGGLHGDVPLESTAGQLVADLIVDRGTSVILDVSQFESDAQKARFAIDFGDRFFFRKKSKPSAVHLFLEECQEFIPQNTQRGEERMLHVWQRLIRLGRNFGIGASMITQRPQDVNKKALNMAECVFAFQTTGPQERKAIDAWMADKGLDLDIAGDLPKLAVGHAHVWSPAWLRISETVKIGKKRTFNASSTPEVGEAARARELAPIDLEKVREAMATSIQRAKENDPKVLQAELARLRAENAKLAARPEKAAPEPKVKRVEVPVLSLKALQAICDLRKTLLDLIPDPAAVRPAAALASMPRASISEKAHIPALPGHAPSQKPHSAVASNGSLPLGERKVLTVAAQYPDGATREQITQLTGYKRSTRDAYLLRVSQRGYVEVRGDLIVAAPAGIAALGSGFEPLPTGWALFEYWRDRLPEGESRLLVVIHGQYPKAVSRDDLTVVTTYQRSTRDAYLQRLKARRLIDIVGRGDVRMSETLA